MTDDFYLTLPSNAGQNTNASSFRVNLPQNIILMGEWEVALVEFIYPKSWYNVGSEFENERNITIEIQDLHGEKKKIQKMLHSVHIAAGHYNGAEDLLNALHDAVPDSLKESISFHYDKRSHRVHISTDKPISNIYLSDDLMYMLGFNSENNALSLHRIADHPPDMTGGIGIIYIYCDIVEHTVLGDKLAPLLRAIPVEGEFGSIVNKVFVAPHYLPVLKKNFSSLEIDIKTDQNKSLDLRFGKTLVKLHFRRRNNAMHL